MSSTWPRVLLTQMLLVRPEVLWLRLNSMTQFLSCSSRWFLTCFFGEGGTRVLWNLWSLLCNVAHIYWFFRDIRIFRTWKIQEANNGQPHESYHVFLSLLHAACRTLACQKEGWHAASIDLSQKTMIPLKVHKIENFFCSDFELCVISLLVMLKY